MNTAIKELHLRDTAFLQRLARAEAMEIQRIFRFCP
jgi:hypothetical protein